MRTRRILLAVALALPLAVSACGGDNGPGGGLDRNDPEAVARAYIESYYDCGDRGAGLRWDLQLHDGGEITRADVIASEQREGCRPTRVPDVETVRGVTDGEVTRIGVINPDACPRRGDLVLVLVRDSDGYKVEPPSVTDDVDCVENGST